MCEISLAPRARKRKWKFNWSYAMEKIKWRAGKESSPSIDRSACFHSFFHNFTFLGNGRSFQLILISTRMVELVHPKGKACKNLQLTSCCWVPLGSVRPDGPLTRVHSHTDPRRSHTFLEFWSWRSSEGAQKRIWAIHLSTCFRQIGPVLDGGMFLSLSVEANLIITFEKFSKAELWLRKYDHEKKRNLNGVKRDSF